MENFEPSNFCSRCGAALRPELAATVASEGDAVESESSVFSAASGSSQHGRFLPGTKIAGRYRIVSLVGKGGMGEVYRADDLKLGQTVALKFLPRSLAGDPQRLEYFHSEVRLTRQISHPNVCRVYDIGESDGQQFLSMEYIDGEDLRGLLRRIGQLPHGKGVQIAQQLCAGLRAAHDRGVLHRDLKPANIMIDGRGHVRITDFGLARLAEDDSDGEIAGTPAYMAPEQLMRGEATIQSDLFSLGLILSEIFSGTPVLKPGSIPELLRAHESSLPDTISLGDDVDPTVKRAIRRCLEREPAARPTSAHAVAMALPGGDPLAAALAAGETPSPEMVAASGDEGRLSLRTAGICLGILLVSLIGLTVVMGSVSSTRELDKGAEAYAQQAENMLEDSGLYQPQDHRAWGFSYSNRKSNGMEFWYRQSPIEMVPMQHSQNLRAMSEVALNNPPPVIGGMVSMRLDAGRALRELLVVPSAELLQRQTGILDSTRLDVRANAGENPILSVMLEHAGYPREGFEDQVTTWKADHAANWLPPVFSDNAYSLVRRSDGDSSPLSSDVERVDVAELGEQVVFFHVVDDSAPVSVTFSSPVKVESEGVPIFYFVITFAITLLSIVFGWRNIVAGRSDLRGARWLAIFMFIVSLAEAVLGSTLTAGDVLQGLRLALGEAARYWLYYVALEPLARRYWPEMLVTWSRGLSGRWQDPAIGRDILCGMLVGIVFSLLAFGMLRASPATEPETLRGTRFLLAVVSGMLESSFGFPLLLGVAMVLVRAIVGNKWLPVIATTLFAVARHPTIFAGIWDDTQPFHAGSIIAYTGYYGLVGVLLARLGVLAAGSFMFCHYFFRLFPWSADWAGPDLTGSAFAVAAILVCSLYGFYTAIGGQSAFNADWYPNSGRRPTR